jgi:hypothetical protein
MLYHSCGNKINYTKNDIATKFTPGYDHKNNKMSGKWHECPYCKRILRAQDCTETIPFFDCISKIEIKSKEMGALIIESIGKLSSQWV